MKTSRRLVANTLAAGLGLSLWGCSTGTPGTAPQLDFNNVVVPAVGFVNPKFDPTAGNPSEIPLPIDILRSSAADANLGLNLGIPDDGTDAARSLRSIRGFSTTGNIVIPFDGQIQGNSVNSQSVLFFEGATSGLANEADFTNTTIAANITVLNPQENGAGGTSTIILQPQRPLRPGRDHFVVITNQVLSGSRNVGSPRFAQLTKGTTPLVDGNGISQLFPLTNAQAQQLEPLRQVFQGWWQRAEDATGRDRVEIPLVFRFGTQNLFPAMGQILQTAAAETQGAKGITSATLLANDQVGIDLFYANNGAADLQGNNQNVGRIFSGRIAPKNFINNGANAAIQPLAGADDFRLAINPLDGTNFFQGTAIPPVQTGPIPPDPLISKGDLVVPFLCCLPVTGKPSALGYPTVIYQHGIDRDKRDVLRIADELNRQGFAVIAIDMWLHGDLKLLSNPQPPSGTGFINPGNLRMTRDNIRQSAGNLLYLSAAIAFGKGELDGAAGPELAPAFSAPNVPSGIFPSYVGHSLGGIVGTVYCAADPFMRRTVLSACGGRLTELLLNSPNRGPVLIAQLAAAPNFLLQGTDRFRQFFLIAQTVLDDADPLNYAAPLRTGVPYRANFPGAANVLQQEVVGDQTIGNPATRDLARAFDVVPGFRHVTPVFEAVAFLTQAASPFAGSGFSQVNFGNHELLLNGVGNNLADSLRVQRQAGDFLRTGEITAP